MQTAFDDTFSALNKHLSESNQTVGDETRKQLTHIFYLSNFVLRCAQQYPRLFALEIIPWVDHLCRIDSNAKVDETDYLIEEFADDLRQQMNTATSEEQAYYELRISRHLLLARVTCADMLHKQSTETSLLVCSKLANELINVAYQYCFGQLSARFGTPENNNQLMILGMGKLGGEELNFSSDIDLIFVFPEAGKTQNSLKCIEHEAFFTKLARKLIDILDKPTEFGRVFRVDMRLRPLGESGPLVVSLSALENYYVMQGREWERFAMQKVRVINETPWNDEVISIIQPFVYKKYLDYTSVESIREMKRLIEQEVERKQVQNNIKLSQGGIREAEFYIQSLQLIHAGRDKTCQHQSFLKALGALRDRDIINSPIYQQLKKDYLFLRKIEQFLQQVDDQQTQQLPTNELDQNRLTLWFKNYSEKNCYDSIVDCMQRISNLFQLIVGNEKSPICTEPHNSQQLVSSTLTEALSDWILNCEDTSVLEQILAKYLNTESIECVLQHLRGFYEKVYKYARNERTEESSKQLLPLLFDSFEYEEQTINKVQVAGVFKVLNAISGRKTYFDLLIQQNDARKRLFELCAKSPWISEQLSRYPSLLDELVHPQYLLDSQQTIEQWQTECENELRLYMLRVDLDDVELVMDKLRAFKHAQQFRIAASDLVGTIQINQVSDKLTALAETILLYVLRFAWRHVTALHGSVQISSEKSHAAYIEHLSIIAYGKFGGYELSYDSDLDIVFLHNAPLSAMTNETGCRKSLTNQEFFIKLVQRFNHLCTTRTYNGVLYEIDLRLRPSGNSGLLISHIDSFEQYQLNKAWTWEHQALVRARSIFVNSPLSQSFNEVKQSVLSIERDRTSLKQDINDMRNKMRAHLYKPNKEKIDFKHAPGGIVDIEFCVQYWVLLNGQSHITLSEYSDNLRIIEHLESQQLIDAEKAHTLTSSYLYIRNIAHRKQLHHDLSSNVLNQLENMMSDVFKIYSKCLGDEK